MTSPIPPGADPMVVAMSSTTATDPHDAYRWLRNECPVGLTVGGSGDATVIISRHEDVIWALRHPEVFSSSAEAMSIGQDHPLIPLQVDPPEHARYRRALDPEFSPRRVAMLDGEARALVNRIIDDFASRGACDFHEDFATPLPSTLFLAIMGLPQSDLPTLLRWRDDTIRPDVDPSDFEEATRIRRETSQSITAYFSEAIAARRADPDDRLLSRIVHGGLDDRPFTEAELLGMCHLLLLGGLDTVTATLDCMIVHLARHPDRRRTLVDDPSAAAAVVEELLRYETPVQLVPRVVAQDVTLSGVDIPAGTLAMVMVGAADTDETAFPDPDVVDFARSPNRHLAFGGGPHRCLGSHLARFELTVALEEFHRRIPDYHLADGAEIRYSPGIRQADHVPLRWPVG
ncbi:MAG: cytochrome P450 [Actinobacteria bacterium]|nr:cytochrome P450 [Actinomycetota bacterium]